MTTTPAVRRRLRLRIVLPAAVLLLLAPAAYSYTATMVQPSSLPLYVRSVEWLRAHHGNRLVDTAENLWYGHLRAIAKGGPQLHRLPALGVPIAAAAVRRPHSVRVSLPALAPARIPPVFPHALRGEGVWKPAGPPVAGAPPVLVTTFRTERAYPRVLAYVAWFDHTRTALAYYPGRYEPPSASVRGPTEVPHDQRWRLLATFNSGFVHVDGNNGSTLDGHTLEPLQPGLATMVAYRNGRVDVVSWRGGPNAGANVAFARQSLPLIVDHGKLSPLLDNSTKWGYTLGNAVRVWRTGAGVDRHGNLIYAAADGQTVFTLARILQRAGAVRGMQLDINPEWPTLITYTHRHGLLPDKVVPNPMQPATRYLVPDDRDFFAVYRREPGPVSVPLR